MRLRSIVVVNSFMGFGFVLLDYFLKYDFFFSCFRNVGEILFFRREIVYIIFFLVV